MLQDICQNSACKNCKYVALALYALCYLSSMVVCVYACIYVYVRICMCVQSGGVHDCLRFG